MVIRNGQVALQQFSANNVPIRKLEVDGIVYEPPSLRNNVILVWVPESTAEKILSSPGNMTSSCNCGNGAKRQLFFPASDINVSLWETGHLP